MADAFGRMIEDIHRDRLAERPVYRRDDGRVSEAHLEGYFAGYDEWSALDRRAVERVSGSVLDAGCGAGRTALWAQREDHEVVGVDRSPGAIRVARDRGLDRVAVADLTNLGVRARFDTCSWWASSSASAGRVRRFGGISRNSLACRSSTGG